MPWYGNATTHHAFKVVRRTRTDVRLRNAYGAEFVEPLAKLSQAGYRELKSKPKYAEKGKY